MKMPQDELQKVSDILAGMAKAKPVQDKRPSLHAPEMSDSEDCPYCQGAGCKKCDEEDSDSEGEDDAQKEALSKVIVILLNGEEE